MVSGFGLSVTCLPMFDMSLAFLGHPIAGHPVPVTRGGGPRRTAEGRGAKWCPDLDSASLVYPCLICHSSFWVTPSRVARYPLPAGEAPVGPRRVGGQNRVRVWTQRHLFTHV